MAETIWESLEDPYILPTETSDEEALELANKRDEEIKNGAVIP